MNTEQLIDSLIADARPVKRLRPPSRRIILWLGIALAVVLAELLVHGICPDIVECLRRWQFLAGTMAPMATGVLAAIGVLMAVRPDRPKRWLLLPVPTLILWVGGVTGGTLANWISADLSRLRLARVLECAGIVGIVGLAIGLTLFILLRPTLRVAPRGTVVVACLAVASFATAVHGLSHTIEASSMLLIWSPGVAAVAFSVSMLICRVMCRDAAVKRPA